MEIINSTKRVNYFDAQYLDVEDLSNEQIYENTKIERLAYGITQSGIVEYNGLEVVPDSLLASPISQSQNVEGLGFIDFPQLQSNGRTRFASSQCYHVFKAHSNNIQRIDLRVNLLSSDLTEVSSLLVQIRGLQVPTNPLSPLSGQILFERTIAKTALPLLPTSGQADNSLLAIDVSDTSDQKGVTLNVGMYYAIYISFPGESTTTDILRVYRSFDPATSSNTTLSSNPLDLVDRSMNTTLSAWFFNNETRQFEQGLRDAQGTLVPYTVYHSIWTAAVKIMPGTAYIKGSYEVGSDIVKSNGLPIVVVENEYRFLSVLSDGTLNHVLIGYTQEGVNSILQPRTGTPVFEFMNDSSDAVVISDTAFTEIKKNALNGKIDTVLNREYPSAFEYPKDSGKLYYELARVADRNTVSLNRTVAIDVSSVSNLIYRDWRFPNNTIPSARATQISTQYPDDIVVYIDNLPAYVPRTLELEITRSVVPGDTVIYVRPVGTEDTMEVGNTILTGDYAGELPTITFEFGEIVTYSAKNLDGYGEEIQLSGIPSTGDNSIKIRYDVGTKIIVQKADELSTNETVPAYEIIENVELLMRMTAQNTRAFTMNSVREVTTGTVNPVTGQPNKYRSYAVILTSTATGITPNSNINTFIFSQSELTPNTFYNFVATSNAGKRIFYQDYDRPVFTLDKEKQEVEYIREKSFVFTLTAGQRIVTIPQNLVLGVNTGATNQYDSRFDINADGSIDEKELIGFQATYGKALGDVGYDSRYDFNGNNVIDDNDRFLLEQKFGSVQNFTTPGVDGYGGIARDEHRLDAIVVYERNNPINKLKVINAASKGSETILYFDTTAEATGTYVLEFGFSDILSPAQSQFTLLGDINYEETFVDLTSISVVDSGLSQENIQIVKIDSIFDDTLQKYKNTFTVTPSFTVSGTYLVTTDWNEGRLATINKRLLSVTSNYEYNYRRHLGPYKMAYDSSSVDASGESFFVQFSEEDSAWADGTFDVSSEHTSGESIRDMFFTAYLFVENPTALNTKPTTSVWVWNNVPATLQGNKYGLKLEYNEWLHLAHRTQGKKMPGDVSNSIVAQPFGLASHQVILKPTFAEGDIRNDLSNLIITRADYATQFIKPHKHLSEADGGELTSSYVKFDDPEGRFPTTGSVTDIIYYFSYLLTQPVTNERVSNDAGIEARKLDFQDTNLSNLLYNGSFELWPFGINFDASTDDILTPADDDEIDSSRLPAPWVRRSADSNGWFVIRPTRLRPFDESDDSQDVSRYIGQNSIKIEDRGSTNNALIQQITVGEDYQERWMTASTFALGYIPQATHVYIMCLDHNGTPLEFRNGMANTADEYFSTIHYSNFHTGLPGSVVDQYKYLWELLQVSFLVPRGTRTITVGLGAKLTNPNAVSAYFDSASLVLGRLAGGFAPVGGKDSLEILSAAVVAEKYNEWTVNFTNLVKNSQFEGWNESDQIKEWTINGSAIQIEGYDEIKSGNYAAELQTKSYIYQDIPLSLFEKVAEKKKREETNINNIYDEEVDGYGSYSKNTVREVALTVSAWMKSVSYGSYTESQFYSALNKQGYIRIRAFRANGEEVTNTSITNYASIRNTQGYERSEGSLLIANESRRTGSFSVDPTIEGGLIKFRRHDLFDEKGFEKITLSIIYNSVKISDFDGYLRVEVVNDSATKTLIVDNVIAVEGCIVPTYQQKPIFDSGREQKLFGSLEIHNSATSGVKQALYVAPHTSTGTSAGLKVESLTTPAGVALGVDVFGLTSAHSYGFRAGSVIGTASGRGLYLSTIEGPTAYGMDLSIIGNVSSTTTATGARISTISGTTARGLDVQNIGAIAATTTACGVNVQAVKTKGIVGTTAYGVKINDVGPSTTRKSYGIQISTIKGTDDGYGVEVSDISSTTGTVRGYAVSNLTGITGNGIEVDRILNTESAIGLKSSNIGQVLTNIAKGIEIGTVITKETSGGNATGIDINNIKGYTSYGVKLSNIGNAHTSVGVYISNVLSTSSSIGANVSNISSSNSNATGAKFLSITGARDTYGVSIRSVNTSVSNASYKAYGVYVDIIGIITTHTAYGLAASNILSTNKAYGLSLTNIGVIGTPLSIGASIDNVNASSDTRGLDVSNIVSAQSARGLVVTAVNGISATGLAIDTVTATGAAKGLEIKGILGTGIVGQTSYGIYKNVQAQRVFDYHGDSNNGILTMRRAMSLAGDTLDDGYGADVFDGSALFEVNASANRPDGIVGMVSAVYRAYNVNGETRIWHAYGTIMATTGSTTYLEKMAGLQMIDEKDGYGLTIAASREHIVPSIIDTDPSYPTIYWDTTTKKVRIRVPSSSVDLTDPYSGSGIAQLAIKIEWYVDF